MPEESETDKMGLALGETLKLPDGSFRKYEVNYFSFKKPEETVKDCFIRCARTIDAMAKVMKLKIT